MHIVVGGCGYIGSAVAERLSTDPTIDVVIIDLDRHAFDRLGASFNGDTVVGSVTDRGVLESAGIERADGFVAVTRSDNTNLMAVEVAARLYGVPRTVARLFNPDNAPAYRALRVNHVSSTDLIAKLFLNELLEERLPLHVAFPEGSEDGLEVCDLQVAPAGTGRSIEELEALGRMRITALTRGPRTVVPSGADAVATGDVLTAAVTATTLKVLSDLVVRPERPGDRG